jgi:very-short-patch-repair endonuclease
VTIELRSTFHAQGGVATSAQILESISRRTMQAQIEGGALVKVWPGVYSMGEPDKVTRLHGLDLRTGEVVTICLGTAAAAFGFATEDVPDLHVLNPDGHLLRDSDGLKVHRRDGAPLTTVDGRPSTTPEWTAIEVARGLWRPRALAVLDAALRSGTCDRRGLMSAAARQAGRRGIVAVRELLPHAAPEAESPMESEARLAMLDGGLPKPALQYEIVDRDWRVWRVDFAWPDQRVAVEYDGFDWHSEPDDLRRDRQKRSALQELGWRVISIVGDDVRRRSWEMVRRIGVELERPLAA